MRQDTSAEVPSTARGTVAIITNHSGDLLLHLRDDLPGVIAWPGHWSLLGGGTDPGETQEEAILRELDEEAGLSDIEHLVELFEIRDAHGSGQMITFFAATWEGDATQLPLAEGVKLQFFTPEQLDILTIPPFIRDGIHRYQAAPPA